MRSTLLALLGLPVRLFYRRWSLGSDVPARGPLLLVANHPNGLVDPLVVASRTERPLRFLAKEPLFRMPVVSLFVRALGSLPVHRSQDRADPRDNERTFAAVRAALAAGEAVCLFPEGRSHSEPALQKLRTGAARMALGAEAEAGFGLGVRIVPVGLVYADKGRFRSKLATWIGAPITVQDLAGLHARDERGAVVRLTERIAQGLRGVTLDLDRWEDLPLLEVVERIWRRGEGRRVPRLRALASGLREARRRDPERVAALEAEVAAFAALLERLGLSARDLGLRYGAPTVARFVGATAAELVLLPIALAGALFWAPPWLAVAAAARAARVGEDLTATAKLLAALVFHPLWWLGTALAAAAVLSPSAGLVLAAASPLAALLAQRFVERQSAARENVAVFLRTVAAPSLRRRLEARAARLAEEVEALAATLGEPAAT